MSEQKPSIGRVVTFTPAEGVTANGAKEFIAIIGQVMPAAEGVKPYCNLFVMPPFGEAYWEGSVPEGTGPRSWRWPDRV